MARVTLDLAGNTDGLPRCGIHEVVNTHGRNLLHRDHLVGAALDEDLLVLHLEVLDIGFQLPGRTIEELLLHIFAGRDDRTAAGEDGPAGMGADVETRRIGVARQHMDFIKAEAQGLRRDLL